MPREIVLGGTLVPGLLILFMLAVVGMWVIDKAAARYHLYHYVWHPALFRLSLFTVIFGLFGLMFF